MKQDFETKLGDAERLLESNEEKHQKAQMDVEEVEKDLSDLTQNLLELNKQLQPCNADGLDINTLESSLQSSINKLTSLTELSVVVEQKLEVANATLKQTTTELQRHKESFDAELYKDYTAKVQAKSDLDKTLGTLKLTISNKLSKLEKLKQHEYDPNCKYCTSNVFVKDAEETKSELEKDKQIVHDFLVQLKAVNDFIEANSHIQTQYDEIQLIIKRFADEKTEQERQQNLHEKLIKDIDIENHKIDKYKKDIQTYKDNVVILNNNKKIHTQIKEIDGEVTKKRIELSKLNNVVKDFHGRIKVAEQTIEECNKSIKHMQELAEAQVAYDLYTKAVSKDGIPYILISKAVPFIENYANNILSQVIDFNIQLETDGKNINAFICYDDAKWPLELSSGMERFLSSLALRIALIKITSLPKPNFIAIDEGLGVLDSTNLNSMNTLFMYMKDLFKFSLVISHIDVVRDMVDNILTIDRKDDLSYIKYFTPR
jgi:DNA repair exonuclease SbcCD ATPase subunit